MIYYRLTLSFFNSLGKRLEEFHPLDNNDVKMYTCGPTVYDFAHLGNFRTFVFQDLLRKYLKYKKYNVYQIQNITDVDDKTIRGAQIKGIKLDEFTSKYSNSFFEDISTLGIEKAEVYPSATDYIPDMVSLIKRLMNKGLAYESKGSIYFRVAAYPEYGKLSQVNSSHIQPDTRDKNDQYSKKDVQDFALWKGWTKEDGDVYWETAIGKGRPGWHIECSAMALKHLDDSFDIHSGGIDLLFPHHENEIAQSEAATSRPFAKYWLHCEHLLVDGQKMSKSMGNYYTLRDLLSKGYNPKAIRYLLLSCHYRAQLNFTFDALTQANNSVTRINDFLKRLENTIFKSKDSILENLTLKTKKLFEERMDHDLSTPEALSVIFDFIRESNRIIDENKTSAKGLKSARELILAFDSIFSVITYSDTDLDPNLRALIIKREEARKKKDWATSDNLRTELRKRGINLEDSPDGVIWNRID